MTNEELLTYLRKEIKYTNEAIEDTLARPLDLETWDSTRVMMGEVFAYESVIKKMRGLTEREFQMEKKRGTL